MDLGPERPGPASSTRQMVEADRVTRSAQLSGRAFWIAFAVILAAIALFAVFTVLR